VIFYAISRVLQSFAVMLVTAFVCFILFNYVGDPINNMVGQETTIQDREALRERLGLNDPTAVQFLRFLRNAAQGDFGTVTLRITTAGWGTDEKASRSATETPLSLSRTSVPSITLPKTQ